MGIPATLAGNNPAVGTGLWSEVVGDTFGSFGNAAVNNTTFTGTAGVTYTLRWTITNGVCPVSTDDVQITINQDATMANAGPDQSGPTAVCGTSTTLAGNVAAIGTGTWSVTAGAGGSFVDVNSPTTVFNGTAGVTYTLRWTITNGVCLPSTDDVIIELQQNPTISNAGPDQEQCNSGIFTLGANTPSVGTGLWTLISGTATITTPSSAISGVTGIPPGTSATLRWTIFNGVCPSSADEVVITNKPQPDITITNGTPLTICSNTQTDIGLTDAVPSSVITLVGVTISGSPGNINGHTLVGTTFTTGSVISDLLINTTNTDQTIQYDFQSTANGCTGVVESITLTVRPNPVFNFTNIPSTICEGASSPTNIVLSSSVVGMRVRIANVIATGGVTGFSPINTQFNLFPATIADVLDNPTNQSQTVTYTLEGSLGGLCVNPTLTNVTVTVNPKPIGGNDSKTVCSDIPVDYNLLTNIATLGNNVSSTFSWQAAPNANVTGETTSATPGSIITDVITNLTNIDQMVIYNVTPTGTNGCVGLPFVITITVEPEPVGVTTSAPDICSGTSVAYDLQNNVNTSGNMLAANFTWTATPNANVTGETTALKSGSIIDDVLTNLTTSNQVVVYTVTPTGQVAGCVGNPFTISVTVNPRAIFTAGPDLTVCVDEASVQIQGSVTFAPSTFSWSGGTFDNPNVENPNYLLSPADMAVTVPTNRVLTLTVASAGACTLETRTMTLTINPLPIVVFTGLPIGAPPQMAENNAPIILTGNQIGGLFTIVPATSNIGSTIPNPVDEAVFDPSAVDLGSNLITYTFTDGNGCTNIDTQEVIVNPVTTIDFAMQIPSTPTPINIPINPLGQFELCSDVGLVNLIGLPPATDGFPPETGFSSTPAYPGGPIAPIIASGGNFQLNTTGLASDTYRIIYTFKNVFGAITFKLRDILVFSSPAVDINVLNSCINSAIDFTDGTTLPPSPFPTTLSGWQWNFADGFFGNQQNPSHNYVTSGLFNVGLTVSTAQGCVGTNFKQIRVGDVPVVDYDWSAICNNDNTSFMDETDPGSISIITNYTWDFGDGDILTGPSGSTIPAGTHGGRTFGTYENPDHRYANFGTYDTQLTVDTNDGCNNSLLQTVFILPFSTVTPLATAAYMEEFEATNGGWVPEADFPSDTSWIWGPPNGATITTAATGQNAWWTGKIGNTYFPNEKSVVNGPCFNLTQLERPMIALDYWSDMENNVDGAVLQYSTNGGITWSIVGPPVGQVDRDEGINWFNGITIPSNPGDQPLGGFGWTNKLGEWKNGRFNLDMIPNAERGQVRLRIAFASNDLNPTGVTFDGFAFDNVFVGNKARNVLVEHFTNSTLPASVDSDEWLDDRLADQFAIRSTSDFSDVRYHISFPNPDPFNLENPADPGARASYYNVSQSPATVMDGILDGVKFKGRFTDITTVELDRRALVDPLFDLALDTLATNNSNTITARLSITATQTFTAPLIAQVVLIEKNVGGSKNVVRKQLFGADGLTISTPWTVGQTITQSRPDVSINVPIVNSSQLVLIGYIQDKNSKEIYQSIVIDSPAKRGSVIVGIEGEPFDPVVDQIVLYPNPAKNEFNFGLPSENVTGYQWKIADQRGIIMLEGNFDDQLSGVLPVDITGIANGVYHVIISGKGNKATYKKLVVMNRN